MSNKCSLAIAPCKSLAGAISHNRQRNKLDYVIPNGEIFTYENQSIKNLDLANVHKYEREQIADLEQIIKDKTGRKSQVKDFYLDGLISLGRETFETLTQEQKPQLQKKVIEFIQQEFKQKLNANIQHVSFHYDEGHKNDNGEWIKNPHIHFTVENVNRNTGKSINRTITKAQLKNLQTSLANQLSEFGFERGRDYSANKEHAPKQVYWKDYKRQQEALSKDKNIEQTNSLKSEIQQLQQENNDLKTQLKELDESYKQARQKLKDSNEATQQDYKQLKENKELLAELLQPKLSNDDKAKISDAIQKMITSAYKDGRKSFAISLESLNDSFTGKIALKGLKTPPVETIVSYKPDKTLILDSIEKSIQPADSTKQKLVKALDNLQNKAVISEKTVALEENTINNLQNKINLQAETIENQRVIIQNQEKNVRRIQDEKEALNKQLIAAQETAQQSKNDYEFRLSYRGGLIKSLEQEKADLQSGLKNLENEKNKIQEENTTIKTFLKALFSAIERLFTLGIVKHTINANESIVERLNAFSDKIEKQQEHSSPIQQTQSRAFKR